MNDTLNAENTRERNASVKYPQQKGRTSRGSRTFNRPPYKMAWCWLTTTGEWVGCPRACCGYRSTSMPKKNLKGRTADVPPPMVYYTHDYETVRSNLHERKRRAVPSRQSDSTQTQHRCTGETPCPYGNVSHYELAHIQRHRPRP